MSDKPYSGPVVAIAGAGRMGRGIAVAGALAGVKSQIIDCLLYTSPSPRDLSTSRMPSSA